MKNLKRCSILKEGNTHYSDSSKPLDKLFDDMDDVKDKFFKDIDKALPKEVTYVSRLEQEITQLKHIVKGYCYEIATLKKSLSKAGEMIEELKKEFKIANDGWSKTMALLNDMLDRYKELKNLCSKKQLAEFEYIMKRKKETE